MPIVYVQDELYCPVCGHKLKSIPYPIGGMYPFIIKIFESSIKYVNIECSQCKAKLAYDRKKAMIKIKK